MVNWKTVGIIVAVATGIGIIILLAMWLGERYQTWTRSLNGSKKFFGALSASWKAFWAALKPAAK